MKFKYTGGNNTDLISFEEPADNFIDFCIEYNKFDYVSFDFDETITLPKGIKDIFLELDSYSSLDPLQARREQEREREIALLKKEAIYSCSLPPPENSERHLFKDFDIPSDITFNKIIDILNRFNKKSNILVTTLRSKEFNTFYGENRKIETILEKENIKAEIIYTTGEPKSGKILEKTKNKTVLHFDDSKAVLLECSNKCIGCIFVDTHGRLFYNTFQMKNWFPKIWSEYVKFENKR